MGAYRVAFTQECHGVESVAAKRILIVDDSQTQLMMEQMVLSSLNCDVITARDGIEAVEKAMAHRPDLILMDVEMPRMDGYEACKRVRVILGKQIPIFLLTTRGSVEHVRRGFESGCTGYMTKPIGSHELLSKVRVYIGE